MKSKERVELTRGEWFSHYRVTQIVLLPEALLVAIWLSDPSYSGVGMLCLLLGAIAILSWWYDWNKLFYQEYQVEMTDEQFERALAVTTEELNWVFIRRPSGIEAFRFKGSSVWCEEKISIKRTANKLLINSISIPEDYDDRIKKNRNKENVNSFLVNVMHILKGYDMERIIAERKTRKEIEFLNKSEWTASMILRRLVIYSMTIVSLFVAIYITNGEFSDEILVTYVCLGMGFIYIASDLLMIWKKRQRRKGIKEGGMVVEKVASD